MCNRKETREARATQNAAAERLMAACNALCPDEIGFALHAAYDSALDEPIPVQFINLLRGLR